MEKIDLTPTWRALLPAFLAVLQDGDKEGRSAVLSELGRMAEAADRWNDHGVNMLRALESVAFDLNTEMPAETAALVQDAINKTRGGQQ